jgi:hypothetical protein
MRLTKKTKKIIGIVAGFLALVMTCAAIGFASDGFTNKNVDEWVLRERNELNLLDGSFTEFKGGDGIRATAKADGTITVNGTYKGNEDFVVIPVQKVALESGTYTLSGTPNGTNQTYYLRAEYNNGSGVTYAHADFAGTFDITTGQEVTISIVVCKDVEIRNLRIQPVLVAGSEIGDFYA